MGLENNGYSTMLNAFAGVAAYASLHTAYPGTDGSNEVTGGSPAYARKSISWNTATSNWVTSNAQIVFDVPGSVTIWYLGYWSALTSGTFYGWRALSVEKTYSGQGIYTIISGDIEEELTDVL